MEAILWRYFSCKTEIKISPRSCTFKQLYVRRFYHSVVSKGRGELQIKLNLQVTLLLFICPCWLDKNQCLFALLHLTHRHKLTPECCPVQLCSVSHWALEGLSALVKGTWGKWFSFTSLSRFDRHIHLAGQNHELSVSSWEKRQE